MRKQTVVLITLALVIGTAGVAVQAADERVRQVTPADPQDFSDAARWNDGTEVFTPPGWPVRYDTGMYMGNFPNNTGPYWTYFGATYGLGNRFNSNSGQPLAPMGFITGVSWVGSWVPLYGSPARQTGYFLMRPFVGPYTMALSTVPMPIPAATILPSPALFFAPLPAMPVGPYGFAAQVAGAPGGVLPTTAGGSAFYYPIFNIQGYDGNQRYIATPSGGVGLGAHAGFISVGLPSLYYLSGNAILRVSGDLLTPIELLSVTAE